MNVGFDVLRECLDYVTYGEHYEQTAGHSWDDQRVDWTLPTQETEQELQDFQAIIKQLCSDDQKVMVHAFKKLFVNMEKSASKRKWELHGEVKYGGMEMRKREG